MTQELDHNTYFQRIDGRNAFTETLLSLWFSKKKAAKLFYNVLSRHPALVRDGPGRTEPCSMAQFRIKCYGYKMVWQRLSPERLFLKLHETSTLGCGTTGLGTQFRASQSGRGKSGTSEECKDGSCRKAASGGLVMEICSWPATSVRTRFRCRA